MTLLSRPTIRRRVTRFARGAVALSATCTALIGLAACASDATTSEAPTSAAAPTTDGSATPITAEEATTDTTAPAYPDGLRNLRYCEVLLLDLIDGQFQADVWNSMGFGECPQEQWETLDAAAIAAERGVLVAMLNGPRYWTLDRIVSELAEAAPTTDFNGLGMFRAATIALGNSLPSQTPYTERGIARETIFSWDGGTEVFQLVSADGVVYTMQSYSQMLDPTMSFETLRTLADRLQLPTGWRYQVVTLTADLDAVNLEGVATVIQDDFQNTYTRIDAAP